MYVMYIKCTLFVYIKCLTFPTVPLKEAEAYGTCASWA